jgi:hypothetical protein
LAIVVSQTRSTDAVPNSVRDASISMSASNNTSPNSLSSCDAASASPTPQRTAAIASSVSASSLRVNATISAAVCCLVHGHTV